MSSTGTSIMWLGISLWLVIDGANTAFVVRGVAEGGPADEAGLLPGDVIVSVDGAPIRDPGQLVITGRSAASVEVKALRSGEPVRAKLAPRAADPVAMRAFCESLGRSAPAIAVFDARWPSGVEVPLTPSTRQLGRMADMLGISATHYVDVEFRQEPCGTASARSVKGRLGDVADTVLEPGSVVWIGDHSQPHELKRIEGGGARPSERKKTIVDLSIP